MTRLPDERAREVIDLLDSYDQMIEDANASKRDLLQEVRAELAAHTKGEIGDEIAGLKACVATLRRRRSAPEKLAQAENRGEIAEAYLALYDRAARAPRATRTRESDDEGPGEQAGDEANAAEGNVFAPADAPESVTAGETATEFTNARPETPPAAQDRGAMVQGQDGSAATTVGITGGIVPVEAEQSVTSPEPGEGAATRIDPAPAPDGTAFTPKPGDLFLDPHHTVSSFMRSSICLRLGLDDDEFDAFRAEMIAGKSAPDAIYAVRAHP
ncbi:hypothetical protein [Enterovirga aerilata]|uniref:Uncharacterized protein n=1 Tax=Enterovirga aerilata TaxID=2730920 RepID=A0A849I592_9HYPH|nr:hypothetical protein [Enterovirga sp. DB1703]NNM75026.1 hypothetical protein [Enterovirga sp. DB1703]